MVFASISGWFIGQLRDSEGPVIPTRSLTHVRSDRALWSLRGLIAASWPDNQVHIWSWCGESVSDHYGPSRPRRVEFISVFQPPPQTANIDHVWSKQRSHGLSVKNLACTYMIWWRIKQAFQIDWKKLLDKSFRVWRLSSTDSFFFVTSTFTPRLTGFAFSVI